jgi:hypothetical protein
LDSPGQPPGKLARVPSFRLKKEKQERERQAAAAAAAAASGAPQAQAAAAATRLAVDALRAMMRPDNLGTSTAADVNAITKLKLVLHEVRDGQREAEATQAQLTEDHAALKALLCAAVPEDDLTATTETDPALLPTLPVLPAAGGAV